jgi:hypothetical protein
MRAVAVSAVILVAFWPTDEGRAGTWCFDPDLALKPKIADLPTTGIVDSRHSSFRGISLASKSGDVAANSLKLGMTIYMTTFVNAAHAVSAIDICRGNDMVGRIDFDAQGQTLRMTLHAGYFYERAITVREFAEAVFKRYSVEPEETADDACFQDVTCFRGRTGFREQFLILKIGGEVQLYVRRLKPAE